ncbi:hypothetical protein K3495_g11808 [Podosphaera aphanis]|nr:hypothetical protein K3495_g11808 [Podosphaera aphanis]
MEIFELFEMREKLRKHAIEWQSTRGNKHGRISRLQKSYPAAAASAFAAQETKEREVQASQIAETCAESAYESRCSYESSRAGVKSLAGVRKQATGATVSAESSSNNATTQESEGVENSQEENNRNLYDSEDDE